MQKYQILLLILFVIENYCLLVIQLLKLMSIFSPMCIVLMYGKHIPLTIIMITLIIDYKNTWGYSNDDYCFIYKNPQSKFAEINVGGKFSMKNGNHI